jgi:formiminotetrahydrofolate cyclodeaminase
MKLIDLSVKDFINEVDSKSPAPGGGSISSLASALGISLIRMVGHLTVSKKKFISLSDEIKLEFQSTIDSMLLIKDELIALIDQDTEAFNQIMKAYQLPKDSEEQIIQRKLKIEEETINAIIIPSKVASLSLAALNHIDIIFNYGNSQMISDLGVGILMLVSGIEGAAMNMLINLSSLNDEMTKTQYKNQADNYIEKANEMKQKLISKIYESLN